MKPFNLERAKAGDPVVTRNGRPVRIICFDRKCDCPIVALIEVDDGGFSHEDIKSYTLNGEYHNMPTCDLNLFMAPAKHARFINIYDDDTYLRQIYETEEEAKSKVSPFSKYICTTKVEWEEEGGAE